MLTIQSQSFTQPRPKLGNHVGLWWLDEQQSLQVQERQKWKAAKVPKSPFDGLPPPVRRKIRKETENPYLSVVNHKQSEIVKPSHFGTDQSVALPAPVRHNRAALFADRNVTDQAFSLPAAHYQQYKANRTVQPEKQQTDLLPPVRRNAGAVSSKFKLVDPNFDLPANNRDHAIATPRAPIASRYDELPEPVRRVADTMRQKDAEVVEAPLFNGQADVRRADDNVHAVGQFGRIHVQLEALTLLFPVKREFGQDRTAKKQFFDTMQTKMNLAMDGVAVRDPTLRFPALNGMPIIDLAKKGLVYMCDQSRLGADVLDHDGFLVGDVLASAWAMAEAEPTPTGQDRMLAAIMHGLSHAQGNSADKGSWCNLRHVVELIKSIKTADMQGRIPDVYISSGEAEDILLVEMKSALKNIPAGMDEGAQKRLFLERYEKAIEGHRLVSLIDKEGFKNKFIDCGMDWEDFLMYADT